MDKRIVLERVKQYTEVVIKNFPVRMIILYGSYAKGTEREYSDIDVAVIVDKIGEDILTTEAKLYSLRNDIDDRIQPVLLEKDEDKSGFLEEILKTGEIIYSSD